jgi:type IV pilus assembly protein PilO
MPKSYRLTVFKDGLGGGVRPGAGRDPRLLARLVLGTLLLANLIVATIAFRPWADSPEQLESQLVTLRRQQVERKQQIERLRILTAKSEKARTEGDRFLASYFLGRRTAASSLVSELNTMAKASGIKPKDHSFAFEPVEGSDTLSIMTITANYEGSYADLIQYVNRLDRSQRFFIVESLAATPMQGGAGVLNVSMKVNVFVREEPPSSNVLIGEARP